MSNSQNARIVQSGYNSISDTYYRRYEINPLNGVAERLRDLARQVGACQVLEVGCGTGH